MRGQTILGAVILISGLAAGMAPAGASRAKAPAGTVQVERLKVHSRALEGNLEGEKPDRDVIVYLPADYATSGNRRYPVVYALHGYGLTADGFAGLLQSPRTIDAAYAGPMPGMIVVLPDTQTLHNGSMYSSSVTIGDWEGFITRDLVAYIDGHYRTIADRGSRGRAGHSMGGYGAARLGMKYPDVFSALYIMSPCCLSARGAPPAPAAAAVETVRTPEEAAKLDFLPRATFAVAAAWSPNPNKPPLFVDLPTVNGVPDASVLARWAANAPLAMVDQNIFNLRRYTAIAIDVGDQDGLRVDAAELHTRMRESGVPNSFEIYTGDHGNRVAERFQKNVLPFFAGALTFDGAPAKP
ncbi:alpha/beta hydrolase-fold protein [Asticcacaulis sp. BE141]|uniref:alpha/beta hydrolase n=1 Tax=Asticcacaulis TaxID=76890 RepID=UPI001AE2F8E1|nr:S-formylglutathione hydrolase FrmB [Asticcacaulis solisilvae]MDR6801309.1 S-formylglutathione hydrolase FrmB [Asticcacaulis sp. BE141]